MGEGGGRKNKSYGITVFCLTRFTEKIQKVDYKFIIVIKKSEGLGGLDVLN